MLTWGCLLTFLVLIGYRTPAHTRVHEYIDLIITILEDILLCKDLIEVKQLLRVEIS